MGRMGTANRVNDYLRYITGKEVLYCKDQISIANTVHDYLTLVNRIIVKIRIVSFDC